MTSSKAGVGVSLLLLSSLLLLAHSNVASAQQRFDDKTWSQPDYQELQDWYMSLPGAGVESYSYRPDGTGICLRDDANGVITGFGIDCASAFPSHKFLKYGDNTTISPDILQNDQWTGNWSNCFGGEGSCWGGYSGGQIPSFNGNIFRWGYGGGVIEQSIALEQVLQATGLTIDGYTYSWRIKNNDADSDQSGSDDPMYVTVDIYNAQGVLEETYEYDYTGHYDWRRFEGFEVFGGATDASTLNIRLEGDDIGFWAGYYGPEFDAASSSINMIYRSDPCATNPLFSPECSGYAEAYAQLLYDQNCSANPLYDSGCPGYAQAYFDQQCTADPLYNASCPGYASAYFSYQCSLDPLFDAACPGYEDALYAYECSTDPLYDTGCPGYAAAYLDQQCGLDPLYDRSCDGYNEAYAQENIFNEETTSTETTVSTAQTETVPVTDPEEIGMPSATGDSTIDSILNDLSDSQPVTIVVAEPPVDVAPEPNQEETQQEEQVEEELASLEVEIDQTETESDKSTSESDGDNSESSDESKGETADGGDSEPSEEDKKKSKREKLKKAIAAKAANLANDMSAAASLEAQQAVQQQVLALINYVPDFNTYQRQMNGGYLPDAAGYPETRVPESRRGLRNGLAQQLLHEQMVEMQYENSSSR